MRPFVLLLMICVAFTSCQNVERTEKPEDLIPEDKMVDVLVELSLLQGAKSSSRSALEDRGIRPDEYLWERFDIDSMQFVRSNDYYAENYREYEEIYGQVRERLELLKMEYDSLREIEDRVRDSINALNPEDSIETAREQAYRDSILKMPNGRDSLMPEPVSGEDSLLPEPVSQGDSIP